MRAVALASVAGGRKRAVAFASAATMLVVIGLSAAPASAQETWSGELVGEMMSPYCPGRTLRNCPSPQAGELIGWIEAQEDAGRARDEVYQQLVSEFGEEIRQAPEASGFGLAAYAIPVAAFLAGGLLVGIFLHHQGRDRAADPSPPPAAALDPELERLVDEELGRRS